MIYSNLLILIKHIRQPWESPGVPMLSEVSTMKDEKYFRANLPKDYFDFVDSRITPEFNKFDDLSIKQQKNFKVWGTIVFIASFLSLFIIGLGISFFEQIPRYFFIIELMFLLFILVAYLVTNRSGHHSKWIDFRLKAEKLRINRFSILTTKPQIYFKQEDGDDQMLERIITGLKQSSGEDVKDYLIKYWLEDQKSFHNKKLKNYSKKETLIKVSIRTIFIMAIFVSLLHLLLVTHLYVNTLILLALGLPALGATLVGIKYHRDFATISSNSGRMVKSISEFITIVEECKDSEELLKTIKKIEWLFVNELERWETIIRSRELELAI